MMYISKMKKNGIFHGLEDDKALRNVCQEDSTLYIERTCRSGPVFHDEPEKRVAADSISIGGEGCVFVASAARWRTPGTRKVEENAVPSRAPGRVSQYLDGGNGMPSLEG